MIGPLLAIFPHPDDETFSTAGVMAAAVERGVPVTVISATRGEAGESSIPDLDDPERLGVVRERELRDAMQQLGVTDVRFLTYRDSGMEGSPEAQHPKALVRAPVEAVATKLVTHIRAVRPQVIITYGQDGIYGHPDHLHLHYAALQAVVSAADPAYNGRATSESWQSARLYFATAPREDLLAMLERPNSPLQSLSPAALANLGTPHADITHVIDIGPWAEKKRAAIAAHYTQTGEGGPLADMPQEVVERRLAREFFVRAPLPWSSPETPADGELDIIAALAGERHPH
ncbi:MAG: PIG-L family deacetylase [Chloroflexi bacterium]|nr:PIG-L family deacetylase [Chloroflexota bacterium]